jgi:hypothetical protein
MNGEWIQELRVAEASGQNTMLNFQLVTGNHRANTNEKIMHV